MSFNVKERYTFELFKIIVDELRDAMVYILERVEKERSKYYLESAPKILQERYFEDIVDENKRRAEILKESFVLLEAKNSVYSPQDISEILGEKLRINNYVSVDERYIRILFSMTSKDRVEELKLILKEYLKEVDFYEI